MQKIVGKMSDLSFNGSEIASKEKIGHGVSGHVYKVKDASGKWMAAKVMYVCVCARARAYVCACVCNVFSSIDILDMYQYVRIRLFLCSACYGRTVLGRERESSGILM